MFSLTATVQKENLANQTKNTVGKQVDSSLSLFNASSPVIVSIARVYL